MTYLEHCKYRRFDGVAVLCTDFHAPEIQELVESGLPSDLWIMFSTTEAQLCQTP